MDTKAGILADSNADPKKGTALDRSEQRFRLVIEHAPIAICFTDEAGRFVLVNQGFCTLLGFSESELLGQHFATVLTEADRSDATEDYDLRFSRKLEWRGEQNLLAKDRTVLTALFTTMSLANPDGSHWRVSFIFDVTDRAQAQRELQRARIVAEELAGERQLQAEESAALSEVSAALGSALEPERLYQIILEQMVRVLPCTSANVFEYVDGFVVHAAGWGEPDVPVGLRISTLDGGNSLWPRSSGDAFFSRDTRIMPNWRSSPPFVGPYEGRSIICLPIVVKGEVCGCFGVGSTEPNVYTERHLRLVRAFSERSAQALWNARLYQMEQERAVAAENLAHLRRDFVAAVSHELRTPLTAILGYGELLDARWMLMDEDRRHALVQNIVHAAQRQKRLVEDLLRVSQLEATAVDINLEPVLLRPLIQQAAAEVRASYRGQHIELDGVADLHVLADSALVVQILVNLLDNAAKYSEEGRSIAITWKQEGAHVAARVHDHGSGIPEHGQSFLFSRFGRVPGSRVRAGRVGTGLGLFLGRALAESMGGRLELETTSPVGSVFCLRLQAHWPELC